MNEQRAKRLVAIAQIVGEYDVPNQTALGHLLSRRGFDVVTQASISRDVRELGLSKVRGYYRHPSRATCPNCGHAVELGARS